MNTTQTDKPSMIYGNARSDDLIDDLSQECCVEVVCLVDANGIRLTRAGTLPSHLTALVQTNINVQMLLARAILTESHGRAYHATTIDPYTAAMLGINEIYALVNNLIAAHGGRLSG